MKILPPHCAPSPPKRVGDAAEWPRKYWPLAPSVTSGSPVDPQGRPQVQGPHHAGQAGPQMMGQVR